MIREAIIVDNDLDAAIEIGCGERGVARVDCNVDVLARAKKGWFGKINTGA